MQKINQNIANLQERLSFYDGVLSQQEKSPGGENTKALNDLRKCKETCLKSLNQFLTLKARMEGKHAKEN